MSPSKILKFEDEYLRNILSTTKTIAIIGLSPDENRPSNFAAKYLQMRGYKIIPINPITKARYILKERVYSNLLDLKFKPDMVDIFIKSKHILPIINDAIKVRPKTIWLQIGIINKTAERKVKNAKIKFVMNRCPKIEYARLSGELGWGGINSGIISSKKLRLMP